MPSGAQPVRAGFWEKLQPSGPLQNPTAVHGRTLSQTLASENVSNCASACSKTPSSSVLH